jgi:hypothetical protein
MEAKMKSSWAQPYIYSMAVCPFGSAGHELFRLEMEWIGEGIQGEYDNSDPKDVPLLRFQLLKWNEGYHEFECIEDTSYCTQIPAWSDAKDLQTICNMLLGRFMTAAWKGESLKQEGAYLSWTGIDKHGRIIYPEERVSK